MSLLKFEDIRKNSFFDFSFLIKECEKYLAHISSDGYEKESLLAHSNLVLDYALKLIEANQLESIFDNMVCSMTNTIQMQNDIKLFFLKGIYWHDIGKINENFQIDKMGNNQFENIENGISSKHSILSAYLYLMSCFDYINNNYTDKKEKTELISVAIYFSLTLWRHHTGLSSSWKEFLNGSEGVEICSNLYAYVSNLSIKIDNKMHQVLVAHLQNMPFSKNENYFFLSKSLFSLLIISDYYATAQFMNYGNTEKLVYKDFGLISDEFRDKVFNEFYIDKYDDKDKQLTFNQALKDKSNDDFKPFEEVVVEAFIDVGDTNASSYNAILKLTIPEDTGNVETKEIPLSFKLVDSDEDLVVKKKTNTTPLLPIFLGGLVIVMILVILNIFLFNRGKKNEKK